MRTALIARVSSSRTPLGACSRSSCSLSAQVTCRMGETLGAETSTVNPTASLLAAAMGTTQLPSLTPQSPVLAGSTSGRCRRRARTRRASSASNPKSRLRKS